MSNKEHDLNRKLSPPLTHMLDLNESRQTLGISSANGFRLMPLGHTVTVRASHSLALVLPFFRLHRQGL
jgi:hypothetical protein